MALTEGANGSQLMTGTAANLFVSQTTLQHYATWIFTNALLAGDVLHIVIFVNDVNGAAERIYDEFDVSGVQAKPGVFIPFVPTNSYRITAHQTAGTNRTITWVRYES